MHWVRYTVLVLFVKYDYIRHLEVSITNLAGLFSHGHRNLELERVLTTLPPESNDFFAGFADNVKSLVFILY